MAYNCIWVETTQTSWGIFARRKNIDAMTTAYAIEHSQNRGEQERKNT